MEARVIPGLKPSIIDIAIHAEKAGYGKLQSRAFTQGAMRALWKSGGAQLAPEPAETGRFAAYFRAGEEWFANECERRTREAAPATETTYDANDLTTKSREERRALIRETIEAEAGVTLAHPDCEGPACLDGGTCAECKECQVEPIHPEPASLEDQFRALLAAGLAKGTVRNIMGEADQENYPAHIAAARRLHAVPSDNRLEIDDAPEVSPGGDPGAWVAAWVWVSNRDARVETDDDADEDGEHPGHELTCALFDGGRCDCGATL